MRMGSWSRPTCELPLVGKTEAVAMQGTALFKLRITSSRRTATSCASVSASARGHVVAAARAWLSVVTTPMKCVTKLSHRSSGGGAKAGAGEGEEGEDDEVDDSATSGANGGGSASGNGTKRKRDDIEPLLEAQGQQLAALQKTNEVILEQLQALKALLSARSGGEVKNE